MRLMFKVDETKANKVIDSNRIVAICKNNGYNVTDFVARIIWEDVSENVYNKLWKSLSDLDDDTILKLVLEYSEELIGIE